MCLFVAQLEDECGCRKRNLETGAFADGKYRRRGVSHSDAARGVADGRDRGGDGDRTSYRFDALDTAVWF